MKYFQKEVYGKTGQSGKFLYGESRNFADFINGCSCQGKQVLKKENLHVRKQVYTHMNKAVKGEVWSIVRDVVMEAELEAVIVLIGLENQSKMHLAMPLRIMKDDLTN